MRIDVGFSESRERPSLLDSRHWRGCFNGRESSVQQLAPYVGKLKSGIARVLIQAYSDPGDTILDPFCGSGVVPFECALAGRRAWANDLSPYAYVLTRGKLEAPTRQQTAVKRAESIADRVEQEMAEMDVDSVPDWVREFFHHRTLREVLAAFRLLEHDKDSFLLSCLLGILHHQRPGFLSYPASHLVPYLRSKKYPRSEYPDMYGYRDLRSRLLAKVLRAYRRPMLPENWEERQYKVWQANAMSLPIEAGSVDAVVSSPPYFGALDYARDNRLRLWFLGCTNWKELDQALTARRKTYLADMEVCLREMHRVLRPSSHCVLVLGDVRRVAETQRTAEMLAQVAVKSTRGGFSVEGIHEDRVPDARRSRRHTRTTRVDRILVMRRR